MVNPRTSWARGTLRLLNRLEPQAATVLTLTYFGGMTEAQVRARTGWSEHVVRAASAGGLRELARLLEAGADLEPELSLLEPLS